MACEYHTSLCSRLMRLHSTEYSWQNLAGTSLNHFAKAAVLIPLVISDSGDSVEVWLTKRSDKVRTDKGLVSFPGGMKMPSDASAVETCLREANEEIGLHSNQVHILLCYWMILSLCEVSLWTGQHGDWTTCG